MYVIKYRSLAALFLFIFNVIFINSAIAFEKLKTLQASDYLDAELIEGEHYRVIDQLSNDGYINFYQLESDFGIFEAHGSRMLEIRIAEINALAELQRVSKTEVFAKAAVDAGLSPVNAILDFSKRPIQTIKGLPSGIGRMFNRYKRTVQTGIAIAGNVVSTTLNGNTDPNGVNQVNVVTLPAELAKRYMGISSAERQWHRELGTDPYTSNEPLASAIKSVAWADRLGRFGLSFTNIPSIPGASIIATANDAVWSMDAYELKDYNQGILTETNADEELIEEFLSNRVLSPTYQTTLIAALASLEGVEGRESLLRRSNSIETETESLLVLGSVLMLAVEHEFEEFISIIGDAPLPGGITVSGEVIVPMTLDQVYWTEGVAESAAQLTEAFNIEGVKTRTVKLTGRASEMATVGISELGWKLQSNYQRNN